METPVSVDENGAKIKPELMESDKLYHCIYKNKVLLFFKDHKDFLNCYEIEEENLVNEIKNCRDSSEIEKTIEAYVQKQNLND